MATTRPAPKVSRPAAVTGPTGGFAASRLEPGLTSLPRPTHSRRAGAGRGPPRVRHRHAGAARQPPRGPNPEEPTMAKPIISADSHITEPPDTYTARIDHRFKDRAPHVVRDPNRGDLFVIEGMDKPIPIGLIAAAGKPAEELTIFGARFDDVHRGGWDPEARLADQEK